MTYPVSADPQDKLATAWARVKRNALLQNYPNPFNPDTWIPYTLAEPADVRVQIYSVTGQLVRALWLGHRDAGVYVNRTRAAHWDGRNGAGEQVASGVYLYRIQAGEFASIRRLVVRK